MARKSKNVSKSSTYPAYSYLSATGRIRYTFLNDYMFKIVFQKPENLSNLLCALLRLKPEEIHSICVNNPIKVGKSASDKTFILDIDILLNNTTLTNIEVQVRNLGGWSDRSLSYLCRDFDQLYHGEKYSSTKSILHIGILDFNIFPDHPEFYSTYKLTNIKSHQIYNDKFELRVLQLNQLHLATEEDRHYGLDRWASLFKATTWEEIKMLAQNNTIFSTIAQELYQSNVSKKIRRACRDREEYDFQMKRIKQREAEYKAQIKQQQSEIDSLRRQVAALGHSTDESGNP